MKPGAKYYDWEMRGVPVRMEIGPRDIDKNQCVLVRRDTRAKQTASLDSVGEDLETLLETIQDDMVIAARERRKNSHRGPIVRRVPPALWPVRRLLRWVVRRSPVDGSEG